MPVDALEAVLFGAGWGEAPVLQPEVGTVHCVRETSVERDI